MGYTVFKFIGVFMTKSSIVSFCLLFSTFSFATSKSMIADCTIPADGDEPQEQFQVFRKDDTYSVRFISSDLDHVFPAQQVQFEDDGKTLNIVFAKYIVLKIHDGDRSDNTSSVILGAPAKDMSCHATL